MADAISIRSAVGWLGCHQIPERCLHFRGKRMSVCARCFGGGIGQMCSLLAYVLGLRVPLLFCLAGPLIMFMDWGLQQWGGVMSTNLRRGTLAGFGLGMLYWSVLAVGWEWLR